MSPFLIISLLRNLATTNPKVGSLLAKLGVQNPLFLAFLSNPERFFQKNVSKAVDQALAPLMAQLKNVINIPDIKKELKKNIIQNLKNSVSPEEFAKYDYDNEDDIMYEFKPMTSKSTALQEAMYTPLYEQESGTYGILTVVFQNGKGKRYDYPNWNLRLWEDMFYNGVRGGIGAWSIAQSYFSSGVKNKNKGLRAKQGFEQQAEKTNPNKKNSVTKIYPGAKVKAAKLYKKFKDYKS